MLITYRVHDNVRAWQTNVISPQVCVHHRQYRVSRLNQYGWCCRLFLALHWFNEIQMNFERNSPPDEYDKTIYAAVAMRAVATITVTTCRCLIICHNSLRYSIGQVAALRCIYYNGTINAHSGTVSKRRIIVQSIRRCLLITDVSWSMCVCWSQPWALQNGWTNREAVWCMDTGDHVLGRGHVS